MKYVVFWTDDILEASMWLHKVRASTFRPTAEQFQAMLCRDQICTEAYLYAELPPNLVPGAIIITFVGDVIF